MQRYLDLILLRLRLVVLWSSLWLRSGGDWGGDTWAWALVWVDIGVQFGGWGVHGAWGVAWCSCGGWGVGCVVVVGWCSVMQAMCSGTNSFVRRSVVGFLDSLQLPIHCFLGRSMVGFLDSWSLPIHGFVRRGVVVFLES